MSDNGQPALSAVVTAMRIVAGSAVLLRFFGITVALRDEADLRNTLLIFATFVHGVLDLIAINQFANLRLYSVGILASLLVMTVWAWYLFATLPLIVPLLGMAAGVSVGVWSLAVLLQPEVRSQFEGQAQAPGRAEAETTSRKAMASLLLGLVALWFYWQRMYLPLYPTALAAAFLGVRAWADIQRSSNLGGRKWAGAGLALATLVPVLHVGSLILGPVSSEAVADLQGTWKAVAVEMEGKEVVNSDTRNLEISFEGGKVTTAVLGVRHHGEFTVTPRSSLHEIDFHPAPDNKVDKPLYGVYRLDDDDRLIACLSPTKRPTELVSKEGRDWVVITFQRTGTALTPKLRLVGRWVKVEPSKSRTRTFTRQTVEFTRNGLVVYSGTFILWTGAEQTEQESGKFQFLKDNQIRVGDQVITIEFVGPDEFVAVAQSGVGKLREVNGRFKRE